MTSTKGSLMTSTQAKEFADFLDALRARFSNPDLDLATVRDIVETMHLAATETRGRQL
jgi:epsilon-lactone hydrolase